MKANVICTALHGGNLLPNRFPDVWPDSVHHIFYRAYDTETRKLLDIQKIRVDRKPVGMLKIPIIKSLCSFVT